MVEVRAAAAAMQAEVVLTDRPRHASALAREALARGCELIVAVGGDGTLNEVGAVLLNTPATFGLIPCGSGNGLGRHLGIHGSTAHALAVLRTGTPRLIDTGLVHGRPFFTAAGLGFEADVSVRFNQLVQRGFLRYLTTSASLLRNYKSQAVTIIADGTTAHMKIFTLAVGNSDQYGNNALIAPGARVDDGLLDLTAVPPVTFFNAVPLLTRLFAGTLQSTDGVLRLRATHMSVIREQAGPIHVDGEIVEAPARVDFAVQPLSLRIMAPSAGPA